MMVLFTLCCSLRPHPLCTCTCMYCTVPQSGVALKSSKPRGCCLAGCVPTPSQAYLVREHWEGPRMATSPASTVVGSCGAMTRAPRCSPAARRSSIINIHPSSSCSRPTSYVRRALHRHDYSVQTHYLHTRLLSVSHSKHNMLSLPL